MSDRCDLARGWLLKARSDLNACRRMLEFWPDQSTASDAVTQAEQVFDLVVNTLPPECRP